MRAIVRYALGLACGCAVGLGFTVERGEPSRTLGTPQPAASAAVTGFAISSAHAASFKVRKILERKKREAAERKAEEERERKAQEKQLMGTRTKELPPDCAYDTEGSLAAGGEVFLCDGVRYQAVKEKDFEGYVAHPVDLDRGEINKARARHAAAEKKRQAAAKKRRDASRRAELPPACAYDANASVEKSTDIYSCDGVMYRQYQEGKETGFEQVNPPPLNTGSTAPRASGGGQSSGY